MKNSDIKITDSKFESNLANIGGAIRYLDFIPTFINQNITNNNFF